MPFVSESLSDVLKPKSEEDIINQFTEFDQDKLLSASIKYGLIKGIKQVLKRDVTYIKCNHPVTPLEYFRNFLIRNKNDFLSKNPSKKFLNKLLKKSCQLGTYELLVWSFEKGANVNFKDNFGSFPLYYAAKHQNFKAVKFLVEHGANINAKSREGCTATMAVLISSGMTPVNEDILWYLIDKGANINAKNNNGNDILRLASNKIANKLMDIMDVTTEKFVNIIKTGTVKNLKKIIEKGNFDLNKKVSYEIKKQTYQDEKKIKYSEFPIEIIDTRDKTAVSKMELMIKIGAKITPKLIQNIKSFISNYHVSGYLDYEINRFEQFLKKYDNVSESYKDILKPKEGALEELEKWSFKNLMQPTPIPEAEEEWLNLNKNLAKELNYQGIKDSEEGNILSFDFETELGAFPGDSDLFYEVAGPYVNIKYTTRPEFSGGLTLSVGHLDDGSKVIYYKGGLINGYIARKEWLK